MNLVLLRSLFVIGMFVQLFQRINSTMPMMSSMMEKDPCDQCQDAAEKFIEGYRRTASSNFGGGNTDWEEKRSKAYAKSETRLIEILEDSCSRSDTRCSSFLEKYEDDIETWYQESSLETIDQFSTWLCTTTAQVCCPDGTFGKNCQKCLYGDNELICSGNGVCNGDGTRSGTGECICEKEYAGKNCSDCADGYKASTDEDNELICTDVNECQSSFFLSPCLLLKCDNTEGSFECHGQPFYEDVSKTSTMVVIIATVCFLVYKEKYGFAGILSFMGSVLLILFAKHLI